MRAFRRWMVLLCLACLAGKSPAQALVRFVLPPCAEPNTTVWLEVWAELPQGQTLKSYDIRIPFDPAQLTLREDLIQQGAWFPSAGPTFFWHDVINNLLYVNAAILGPGLHVTGSGVLFRLPVDLGDPGVFDLGASVHDLFDVNAQLIPSLALPAALQAPCTSFNLRIDYLEEDHAALLEWDPQGWTEAYRVYAAPGWNQPWELAASTTATTWTDPVSQPGRIYRVRALFTSGM